MKKFLFIAGFILAAWACSGGGSNQTGGNAEPAPPDNTATVPETQPAASDKGIGKFQNVQVAPTLNQQTADKGQKVYDVKCASCHRLNEERLVGPGWKDVTKRHTPEWIMNFVTNVDEMLAKDPKAQAQLEICLVRMPNQNLTDDDARSVYEYMRKNDGVK